MERKEWRRELRGAVYRGDGDAGVACLRTTGLHHDALQLAGDTLLAAIAQRVDGAARIAAECVEGLRRRGWSGDDDLADHLEAATGRGPDPALQPLGVDLDELAGILEGDFLYGGGRIDLDTGEVWPEATIDAEEDAEAAESGNWLWVDCEGSRQGYRDMELFIDSVTDRERADLLEVAIQGRGAFRRFKDVLARWPDELERWYGFAEDRLRGRARAWLTAAGYRVTVPTTPLPWPPDPLT